MENKKQGRYPKGHPREGGYCVLWARQTLASEKLKNPLIAGCFFKVLAVAQLIDYETGVMARSDMPISAITIANRAGITGEQFNRLVDMELITKKAINGEVIFSVKSWQEHQNPKNAIKEQKESPFNSAPSINIQHTSFNKHHSSNNKQQRVKKSVKEYESDNDKIIESK